MGDETSGPPNPSDPRAPAHKAGGPTLQEKISEARSKMAGGESGIAPAQEAPQPAPASEETTAPATEATEAVEAPEQPQEGEQTPEQPQPPTGWSWDVHGRLHRPDGTLASAAQTRAVRAGEDPLAMGVPTEDEEEAPPESEEEAAPEAEGEDEVEFELVQLPGRQPDDPDEEWEITDPELAERIRQLKNGYMRGEEARRQVNQAMSDRQEVQAERAELDAIYEDLQYDPINFIMDSVGRQDVRKQLAVHLLTDQEIFNHVAEEFKGQSWDTPEMRAKRAELALQRKDAKEQGAQRRMIAKKTNDQMQQIAQVFQRLAPQVPDAQRQTFIESGLRKIQDYLRQRPDQMFLQDVPRDVVGILNSAGTLRAFGVNPDLESDPVSAAEVQGSGSDQTATVERPAAPAPTGPAAASARKRVQARRGRTADDFKAARESRKEAAAVAQGGAGAVPSRREAPKGQDVNEAIKWYRKHGLT